jgi:hypothetical protein
MRPEAGTAFRRHRVARRQISPLPAEMARKLPAKEFRYSSTSDIARNLGSEARKDRPKLNGGAPSV